MSELESIPLDKKPAWIDKKELFPKRIDPLYYDPRLTVAEKFLLSQKNCEWRRLRDVALDIYSFGAYELCNYIQFVEKSNSSIPFITVSEMGILSIDNSSIRHIDSETHRLLERSKCAPGTLLLSMSGTIGRTAVVPDSFGVCNSNQDVAKIIVNSDISDAYFLATYFASTVGQNACFREAAGAIQKHMYLFNISELPVPNPSKSIRVAIGNKVRAAEHLKILLCYEKEELKRIFPDLKKKDRFEYSRWVDIEEVDSGRMEAEYYEIIYKQALEQVEELDAEISSMGNLIQSSRHGANVPNEYTKDGSVRLIRGMELIPNRISRHERVFLSDSAINHLSAGHYAKTGEVLVTRSGTVGVCAVVRDCDNGSAFGSFVIGIKLKDSIEPEYVSAFLNSPLGQIQFRREENGAVQLNINNEELSRIKVPILDESLRKKVVESVGLINSYSDRSEDLIAEAINDVEQLIDGTLDQNQCLTKGRQLAEEFGLEHP